MTRRFDDAYREQVRLDDGTEVLIRPLRRDDAALVRAGFDHLSADSRYLRCLAATPRLSPAVTAYLTAVDGENHFALGAVRETANTRMRNLLRDIAPSATIHYDGPTFTAEILDLAAQTTPPDALVGA